GGKFDDVVMLEPDALQRFADIVTAIVEDFAVAAIMRAVIARDDNGAPIGKIPRRSRSREKRQCQRKQHNDNTHPVPRPHHLAKAATSSICDDHRNWSTGVTAPSL